MDRAAILACLLGLLIGSRADAWEVHGRVVRVEPSYMPEKVGIWLDRAPPECRSLDWKLLPKSARDQILEAEKVYDTAVMALVHGLEVTVWGQDCLAEEIVIRGDGGTGPMRIPDAPKDKADDHKQWLCRAHINSVKRTATGLAIDFEGDRTGCDENAPLIWKGMPGDTPGGSESNQAAGARAFAVSMSRDKVVEIVGAGCSVYFVQLSASSTGNLPCRPY